MWEMQTSYVIQRIQRDNGPHLSSISTISQYAKVWDPLWSNHIYSSVPQSCLYWWSNLQCVNLCNISHTKLFCSFCLLNIAIQTYIPTYCSTIFFLSYFFSAKATSYQNKQFQPSIKYVYRRNKKCYIKYNLNRR